MERVRTDDLSRAESLPARMYHDPATFERERLAIFGREWLLVAHEAELARPGDAVAERLAGWPVFVRRNRDGQLHGFHDVCRHRAGPIVGSGEHGEARVCPVPRLRCRYHGWLYDEAGRLEQTPDFGDALDFEPRSLGLEPLRVASWRGFVFACLDPQAPPLDEALGRLPALAESLPLEGHRLQGRGSYRLRCNWKTYVENYLEGYHIPHIHPRLNREIDLKGYAIAAAERVVTHHVPPRATASAPVYDGLWAWLWPNVAFNMYGDGLSVERMLPDSPTTMRIEYLFLFAEGSDGAASRAMSGEVTDEDRRICEAVQQNLEAGIYERGRLSPRHEGGVHFFQQLVRRATSAG